VWFTRQLAVRLCRKVVDSTRKTLFGGPLSSVRDDIPAASQAARDGTGLRRRVTGAKDRCVNNYDFFTVGLFLSRLSTVNKLCNGLYPMEVFLLSGVSTLGNTKVNWGANVRCTTTHLTGDAAYWLTETPDTFTGRLCLAEHIS